MNLKHFCDLNSLIRLIGKRIPASLTVVFAAFTIVVAGPAAQSQRLVAPAPMIRMGDTGSFVRGEIIVAKQATATDGQMKLALSKAGTSLIRPLRLPGYYLIKVDTAGGFAATEEVTRFKVKMLKADSVFRYADMNYYVWSCDTTPNDAKYSEQWGYPLINMPKAWDLAKGTTDVVFASLDTGVDVTHPEFAGRVIGARNFTVTPNTNDAIDGHGHGTHTTGTATAATGNSSLFPFP